MFRYHRPKMNSTQPRRYPRLLSHLRHDLPGVHPLPPAPPPGAAARPVLGARPEERTTTVPAAAETFVAPSSMASGFALPDSMEEAAERFGWIDLVFRQFLRVLCSRSISSSSTPYPFCLFSDRPLVQFSSSSSPARPSDAIPAKPPHPHDRPAAVAETPSAPGAPPPRLVEGEGSPPF